MQPKTLQEGSPVLLLPTHLLNTVFFPTRCTKLKTNAWRVLGVFKFDVSDHQTINNNLRVSIH